MSEDIKEKRFLTVFKRPSSTEGIWSWITTVDHKKIGIMYGYAAFFFLLLGGLEALILRIQLAKPDNDFLSAAEYNAMFTMHGTTMVFLVIMPLSAAFFNYLLPLQIGARDVAFPRLNALSYWLWIFGGLFLYSTFIFGSAGAPQGGYLAEEIGWLGNAPNGGWFGYQPNASFKYSPGTAMDYWALGHIHRFQVLRESNPAIVYSGNTQARHMREAGEKGCCLVTLDKNADPLIQFISTDTIRYVHGEVDLSGTISLDEVIHAVRSQCEYFAGQVKQKEMFLNLSLKGRTQIHSELQRGDAIKELQGEIRTYFQGRTPSIWVDIKLNTAGIYNIKSLREGKDFISDLIVLFENMEKEESFLDLKQALKPVFETWQGKKYFNDLSDKEIKNILSEAKSLCLDKLLK